MTSGYPREEPYAGKPHVRICEGESRMAELLDHPPRLLAKVSCEALWAAMTFNLQRDVQARTRLRNRLCGQFFRHQDEPAAAARRPSLEAKRPPAPRGRKASQLPVSELSFHRFRSRTEGAGVVATTTTLDEPNGLPHPITIVTVFATFPSTVTTTSTSPAPARDIGIITFT